MGIVDKTEIMFHRPGHRLQKRILSTIELTQ